MPGVNFDLTIQLGTIIQVGAMIGTAWVAWSVFKTKVDLMIEQHAELIAGLVTRLDKHEVKDDALFKEVTSSITNLVGGVQRLVGQNEAFRISSERRKS